MPFKIIAIDGPAGSGKSTTAKLVAKRLGFLYLDTGAMYRAITLKALENKIDVCDEEKLERLVRKSKIEFRNEDCSNKIFLDGKDVTPEIRTPLIDKNVSYVSEHKNLRKILVELQRKMGEKNDLVAEGRDTTTVVFPDALVKIYLDCKLEERAKRRFSELEEKGIKTTLKEQLKDLTLRDNIDSKRENSPLTKDKNAYLIDTTDLTIEEQVQKVIRIYNKKTLAK
jgi:cytidylate kinase